MQTQRPTNPTSYEGPDNSYDDVDHVAEAAAVDDATGQGASDATDNRQKIIPCETGSIFLLL